MNFMDKDSTITLFNTQSGEIQQKLWAEIKAISNSGESIEKKDARKDSIMELKNKMEFARRVFNLFMATGQVQILG